MGSARVGATQCGLGCGTLGRLPMPAWPEAAEPRWASPVRRDLLDLGVCRRTESPAFEGDGREEGEADREEFVGFGVWKATLLLLLPFSGTEGALWTVALLNSDPPTDCRTSDIILGRSGFCGFR